MNKRPNLAQLLAEATSKANEERDQAKQVERVTADVKKRIAAHLAETSKDYPQCPHCGGVLEGWQPNEETSGTDNDDDQNEGDAAQVPKWDNRKLTPLQRALKSKGIDPFAED